MRFDCAVSKGKRFKLPYGHCTCEEVCPEGTREVPCGRRRRLSHRRDLLAQQHSRDEVHREVTLRGGACCGTVTQRVWWDDDR